MLRMANSNLEFRSSGRVQCPIVYVSARLTSG